MILITLSANAPSLFPDTTEILTACLSGVYGWVSSYLGQQKFRSVIYDLAYRQNFSLKNARINIGVAAIQSRCSWTIRRNCSTTWNPPRLPMVWCFRWFQTCSSGLS